MVVLLGPERKLEIVPKKFILPESGSVMSLIECVETKSRKAFYLGHSKSFRRFLFSLIISLFMFWDLSVISTSSHFSIKNKVS